MSEANYKHITIRDVPKMRRARGPVLMLRAVTHIIIILKLRNEC